MAERDRRRYTRAVTVTPNDSSDLSDVADALYVGTGGHISVIFEDDTSPVTLNSFANGGLLENIRISRVRSTGTTASNIVALY